VLDIYIGIIYANLPVRQARLCKEKRKEIKGCVASWIKIVTEGEER
jgi:hypothetical protein